MVQLIWPHGITSYLYWVTLVSVAMVHRLVARGNVLALGVLVLCVLLTSVNIHQLRKMQADFMSIQESTVIVGHEGPAIGGQKFHNTRNLLYCLVKTRKGGYFVRALVGLWLSVVQLTICSIVLILLFGYFCSIGTCSIKYLFSCPIDQFTSCPKVFCSTDLLFNSFVQLT